MKKINKKAVMTLAALMILIYHYWLNVTPFKLQESFVKGVCFLGADIFFFMSAYSIGSHPITSAKKFWLSRLENVYVKFVFWAAVEAVIAKWPLTKFAGTVFTIDLFLYGGGAFLWFLPAIMFFYLFLFIYQKAEKRFAWQTPVATAVLWLAVGLLITGLTAYRAIFIVLCRVPILLLGYYMPRLEDAKWFRKCSTGKGKLIRIAVGIVMLVAFTPLVYRFAYISRLQTPVYNMFYLICIPTVVALILLSGSIPENPVTKALGSVTLEIYAVQMVFGTKLLKMWMQISKKIWASASWKNYLFTDITTFFTIILIALAVGSLYNALMKKLHGRKNKA